MCPFLFDSQTACRALPMHERSGELNHPPELADWHVSALAVQYAAPHSATWRSLGQALDLPGMETSSRQSRGNPLAHQLHAPQHRANEHRGKVVQAALLGKAGSGVLHPSHERLDRAE